MTTAKSRMGRRVLSVLLLGLAASFVTVGSVCFANAADREASAQERAERRDERQAEREVRQEAREDAQQAERDARRQEQAAQQDERREVRQEVKEAQREVQREAQAARRDERREEQQTRQEERRQERSAQQEERREVRQEARAAQREAQREGQQARREERQEARHAEREAQREERIRIAQAMPHVARNRHAAGATDGVGEVQDLTRTLRQLHRREREGAQSSEPSGVEQKAEHAQWDRNPHDTRGQGNNGRPDMQDPYGFDKESGREGSEHGRPIEGEAPAPEDSVPPAPPLEDPVVEPGVTDDSVGDVSVVEDVVEEIAAESESSDESTSNVDAVVDGVEEGSVGEEPVAVNPVVTDPDVSSLPSEEGVTSETETSASTSDSSESVLNMEGMFSLQGSVNNDLLAYHQAKLEEAEALLAQDPTNRDLQFMVTYHKQYVDWLPTFNYDLVRVQSSTEGLAVCELRDPSGPSGGNTVDLALTLADPEQFAEKTFLVTTTVTTLDETMLEHYSQDPQTGEWTITEVNHNPGDVVDQETQEVTFGADGTLNYNFIPTDAIISGMYTIAVTVTDPVSGQSYTMDYDRQLQIYKCPYGIVYDQESGEPIAGATVTVHNVDGSVAVLDKAANPNVHNPQVTDATGRYNCKLAIGKKYYLQVEVPGYASYRSQVFSERWHIVREDVGLTRSMMLSSK